MSQLFRPIVSSIPAQIRRLKRTVDTDFYYLKKVFFGHRHDAENHAPDDEIPDDEDDHEELSTEDTIERIKALVLPNFVGSMLLWKFERIVNDWLLDMEELSDVAKGSRFTFRNKPSFKDANNSEFCQHPGLKDLLDELQRNTKAKDENEITSLSMDAYLLKLVFEKLQVPL